MGWSFSKSVNLGPLRINFSKSGIGASFGVRGARVSAGPRGTYIHMGGGGVYYRERIGGPAPRRRAQPRSDFKGVVAPEQVITTADVSALTDSSADGLIQGINSRLEKVPAWPFLLVIAIAVAFLASLYHPIAGLIVLVAGVGGVAIAYPKDVAKRTSTLLFELDADAEARFNSLSETLGVLARAQRLWRVVAKQQNFDWKRNAGASDLIRRSTVSVYHRSAPYLASNVIPWCVNAGAQELWFFPDRILIRQGMRYGAVAYANLHIESWTTRFIEEEGVPSDAQVIDYAWRYVRRDGGPDRRFANNRKLPVVLYGFLRLSTSTGMDLHFHLSDHRIATWFGDAFRRVFKPPTARRPDTHQRVSPRTVTPAVAAAYRLLDLSLGSSYKEVQTAYHQLVKLYHPDKVSHLAPSLRQLAHQRMQELNAAVAVLRKDLAAA